MLKVKVFIAILLAFLMLIVILQNTETVETKFLTFSISAPRAMLLFGTTFFGFALGVIVSLILFNKKD